jgi:hypothetical protein
MIILLLINFALIYGKWQVSAGVGTRFCSALLDRA